MCTQLSGARGAVYSCGTAGHWLALGRPEFIPTYCSAARKDPWVGVFSFVVLSLIIGGLGMFSPAWIQTRNAVSV